MKKWPLSEIIPRTSELHHNVAVAPDDVVDGLPFVNILGNHDYGGASYICSDGDNNAKCNTRDELIATLENKFKWQLEYTSPNDDRRVRKDHFYVYTIEDTDSGASIDIFNVDLGDAGIYAAPQVCCQCYGYSDGETTRATASLMVTTTALAVTRTCANVQCYAGDREQPLQLRRVTNRGTRGECTRRHNAAVVPDNARSHRCAANRGAGGERSYRHKAAVVPVREGRGEANKV
ncbi:Metallo-dependent phosphatase-like [Phytophthora cactorum]|nr:Metallo-dependent phosphatase-like [Phytophthora cactorum]